MQVYFFVRLLLSILLTGIQKLFHLFIYTRHNFFFRHTDENNVKIEVRSMKNGA